MTANGDQHPDSFVRVFSSSKPVEIEIAIALLSEAGIESFKINKSDSSYIFGDIELYVHADQLLNAQTILVQNDLL